MPFGNKKKVQIVKRPGTFSGAEKVVKDELKVKKKKKRRPLY